MAPSSELETPGRVPTVGALSLEHWGFLASVYNFSLVEIVGMSSLG